MTSTTGQGPHPEVSELSDWSEGLLPAEREAVVRAHVDGCGLCADVVVSLEEIRGLLGTLPSEPMPADVAARIDAALAAETVLDASGDRAPAAASETAPESTLAHVPRETSTGAGTGAPGGRPAAPVGPAGPTAPTGAAGPGRTGSTRSGHGGRRARRRRALLTGGYAAAVLALGGVVYGIVEAGGSSSNGAQTDSSTAKTQAGASAGSADSVASSVRALLAQQPGQDGAATDRGNSPMLSKTPHPDVAPAGPTAVPACVLSATHRAQQPIASEREVFQGVDAYLLVLPHPADSSRVDAFVVNASCTPAAPGTVLFQGTYAR
jgi:hypothetical protein